MTPLRMLALSPVPEEGAGCRFRIAQYVPALRDAGIEVTLSPFYTTEFFRLVYQRGRSLHKAALFLERAIDRVYTLAERRRYDVIFIYREAFPIGPAVIEALLARTPRAAIVYDFDDAIYLPNTSEANRAISVLKWPAKVQSIMRLSHVVIAGNEYLAEYARRYSRDVRTIPTVVDTGVFVPDPRRDMRSLTAVPVIGWIGTPTTAPYLQHVRSMLQEVAHQHPFILRVGGAGAELDIPGVTVENVRWTLDGEVSLFNTCDVGIYPMPDDQWARGKCGFKAIQFMACAVPVVASAVGVNREIVHDGANGFLAATPAEWVEKLGRLISNRPLRHALGDAGRRTVEERYSLRATAPLLVSAVTDAVKRTSAAA